MAIKVSLIDGMGTATTDGETVTLDGATSSDFMHIANDVLTSAGVHDNTGTSCQVIENSPAGMSVLVKAGVAYVLNSSYVLGASTQKYFRVENSADFEVAIASNGAGSTRIDLICAKVDVVTTPDNTASNVGTLVRVGGTAGAGVPATPALHTVLAQVSVASGAVSIVTANITDVRENITFNNNQISELPYSSTDGKIWYEELGRTTLSVSAGTMTVSNIPPRRYLRIILNYIATGGTANAFLRFNGDSSTNYFRRLSVNGGADSTSSETSAFFHGGTVSSEGFVIGEVVNVVNKWKILQLQASTSTIAGDPPTRIEALNKWENNTNLISSISIINDGSGSYAPGSEVIVLGHD